MPTPVSGGVTVKCVQFFNGGRWGWTESYFLNVVNSKNTIDDGEYFLSKLNAARRTGLDGAYNLEASRVDIQPTVGSSSLSYMPALSCGSGLLDPSGTAPGAVWLGWLCSGFDDSEEIHDERIFRGWSTEEITVWQPSKPVPAALPPAVATFVKNMRGILTVTQTRTSTGAGGRWCLPSFDRTIAVDSVDAVTLDGAGHLQFQIKTPTGVYLRGQQIHVHVNRMKCVRGVSGRYTITSVTPGTPGIVIGTSKLYECNITALPLLTGAIQRIVPAFYPYAFFQPERMVKKSTGRPFFGTRGRQAAKS